jgi:hypothetical protein
VLPLQRFRRRKRIEGALEEQPGAAAKLRRRSWHTAAAALELAAEDVLGVSVLVSHFQLVKRRAAVLRYAH